VHRGRQTIVYAVSIGHRDNTSLLGFGVADGVVAMASNCSASLLSGYLVLPACPLAATLISVTVEGSVSSLCPTPSLLGLDVGLCDVIVEGGVPSNPGACCPRGLSIPSSVSNWVPPSNYFQCVSDVAKSPFNLTLDSVSDTFQDSAVTRVSSRDRHSTQAS
jgi:hypothetical protein